MEGTASLDVSPPCNPEGEPLCGLAPELWVKILSYLKGADPLRLMQVSTVHRDIVATEFKTHEPLKGKPSALLVQAARTNDTVLVCRCFRAGISNPETKSLSMTLAYRIATQVRSRERRGEDASSARLALCGLIRKSPETLYIGDESVLQQALRKRRWEFAHTLLQYGASVNHKDRLEGAKAPIVTCLESMTSDEPPPSDLLDALLGENLKFDALNHRFGSPVWLIEDLAAKVPAYTAPESFKEHFATFFKGNPDMLNATRMKKFRDFLPTEAALLHCLFHEGSIQWMRWLLENTGTSALYATPGKRPLLFMAYGARRKGEAGRALHALIKSKTEEELKKLESIEPCWLADFAREGFLTSYELVLAKATDLNTMDQRGRTALCIWAARCNWREVESLLELGARVDVGELPLHAALRGARYAKDAEAILSGLWERLLTEETAQGALLPLLSKNWADFGEEAGKLQLSLCKEILSYDKALDMDEGFRGSPLDIAASFKRPDLIEAILNTAYPDGLPEELPWFKEALSCESAVVLFDELSRMGFPVPTSGEAMSSLLRHFWRGAKLT